MISLTDSDKNQLIYLQNYSTTFITSVSSTIVDISLFNTADQTFNLVIDTTKISSNADICGTLTLGLTDDLSSNYYTLTQPVSNQGIISFDYSTWTGS